MSKQFLLRWAALPCATLALAAMAATTLAAEPGPEAARLNCFTHPDGTTYFALSLQPPAAASVAGPRDVVDRRQHVRRREGRISREGVGGVAIGGRQLGSRGPRATDRGRLDGGPLDQGFCRSQQCGMERGGGGPGPADTAGLQRHGEGPFHGGPQFRRGQPRAGGPLHRRRQQPREPLERGEVSAIGRLAGRPTDSRERLRRGAERGQAIAWRSGRANGRRRG